MLSTPNADIDFTKLYGQFLVATFIATALWGMQCVQIFIYLKTYISDAWYIKALIAVLLVLDTIHEVLCMQTVWNILIPQYGDTSHLKTLESGFLVQEMITGIVAAIVHCFFTWRIWKFSGRKWIFPIILLPLTFAQMAGFSVYTIKGLIRRTFSYSTEPATLKIISISSIALVVVDCFIAVTMCILLWKRRTNLEFSDRVLVRLIHASMSTGICTAVFALAAAISTMMWPFDLFCVIGEISLCALYCNVVLANLNSRKYIRSPNIMLETASSATVHHSSQSLRVDYCVASGTNKRPL